jgi:hypothetical protein
MAFACIVVSLCGCASYEVPKPGIYRGPGEKPAADIVCGYETPTATRFVSMRCRRVDDIEKNAQSARDTADSFRTAPPEIR